MRKTQDGRLNCVIFFFFIFKTKSSVQSLIEFKVWNKVQSLMHNVKSEREEKDTKKLYRFLPRSGSSLVPLALPRRVHENQHLITIAQAQKQET